MARQEENALREHTFDGIQEYDNDLPRWWLWSFYLSIVWAFFYGMHYHWLDTGKIGIEALAEENRIAREIQIAMSGDELSEEVLRELSHDSARIEAGQAIYVKANCAMCHGADAYGNVGVNLRDDFWKHGSDMTTIVISIRDGRANNQMPPQGHLLAPDDIYNLACYIADLNRSTPKSGGKTSKGKVPEGELMPIEY